MLSGAVFRSFTRAYADPLDINEPEASVGAAILRSVLADADEHSSLVDHSPENFLGNDRVEYHDIDGCFPLRDDREVAHYSGSGSGLAIGMAVDADRIDGIYGDIETDIFQYRDPGSEFLSPGRATLPWNL